ncbi:hypothetical protein GCM10007235_33080 [Pseudoxanthomonas indica]|nr:hypothetical protein GCM10007235_33080 [Pseudoxanthomonas indica]
MTEERLNTAVLYLQMKLQALQHAGLDPYDVREQFILEVRTAASNLSPPRRIPLYDRAAGLLDDAGLGFRPST